MLKIIKITKKILKLLKNIRIFFFFFFPLIVVWLNLSTLSHRKQTILTHLDDKNPPDTHDDAPT